MQKLQCLQISATFPEQFRRLLSAIYARMILYLDHILDFILCPANVPQNQLNYAQNSSNHHHHRVNNNIRRHSKRRQNRSYTKKRLSTRSRTNEYPFSRLNSFENERVIYVPLMKQSENSIQRSTARQLAIECFTRK